jgi:uncharacterized protein YecE (DUF72 family)
VQLPPKLEFDPPVAVAFLKCLRKHWSGRIEIEPRHVSWSDGSALGVLKNHDIGLVYADPQGNELRQVAIESQSSYLRLHGSPKVYCSSYSAEELTGFAGLVGPHSWCIFDNTASGAAQINGIEMLDILGG